MVFIGTPTKLAVYTDGIQDAEEVEAFLSAGRAARLEAWPRSVHYIAGSSEADVCVLVLLASAYADALQAEYKKYPHVSLLVKEAHGFKWLCGGRGVAPRDLDEVRLGKWLVKDEPPPPAPSIDTEVLPPRRRSQGRET